MRTFAFRSALAAASLFVVTTSASPAAAQGATADQQVAAQALYDKALELMQAQSYAEACPKLEEVTRLIPEGLGAKLTLAECYEKAGRLASAYTQYAFVETMAARTGQGERQRLASERAAAIKPKLAYLMVQVPDAVKNMPGLAVTRNGAPVGPAQFGIEVPADVGPHVIEASATGKKVWKVDARIPADGAHLTVDVPVLEDDPEQRLKDLPPSPGPAEKGSNDWMFPVGFAVGGTGVAALGVGFVLGAVASGKNSDAEAACPAGRCSAEGNDLRSSAGGLADVSTIMVIAGGVLAAGGATLLVLAPWGEEGATDPATTGHVELDVGPGWLGVHGTF